MDHSFIQVLDGDEDVDVDGELETDADGDVEGDVDGELDGLLETDADRDDDGDADGDDDRDADGLLETETTKAGTTENGVPRHMPETIVSIIAPSHAHLSVDCSQKQHHTDLVRGYTIIDRLPLGQFPLSCT
jgi:hypothetical protein